MKIRLLELYIVKFLFFFAFILGCAAGFFTSFFIDRCFGELRRLKRETVCDLHFVPDYYTSRAKFVFIKLKYATREIEDLLHASENLGQ